MSSGRVRKSSLLTSRQSKNCRDDISLSRHGQYFSPSISPRAVTLRGVCNIIYYRFEEALEAAALDGSNLCFVFQMCSVAHM